jgi:hypothetical protein
MRVGTAQSRGHAVPRDEACYGDVGTHDTYSRREYKPLPWIPELLSLKTRVEEATPVTAYANVNLPRLGYNAQPVSKVAMSQPT